MWGRATANRCPTCVTLHVLHVAEQLRIDALWVMSRIGMSHVTNRNESCHTLRNESWHTSGAEELDVDALYVMSHNTFEWAMSRYMTHRNIMPHIGKESCHAYEWVMSHIRRVMSHTGMGHVTCMNQACHTRWGGVWYVISLISHSLICHSLICHSLICHSLHTHEWIMSHIWMSHVKPSNESCHR